MKKLCVYTIDTNKMIKFGEDGWNAHQDQAKTFYNIIEKDNKDYTVNVIDNKIITELFSFTNITEDNRQLDKKDNGILLSIKHIKNDDYALTYYFHPANKKAMHYTISCYSVGDSDYIKAKQIIDYINSKAA